MTVVDKYSEWWDWRLLKEIQTQSDIRSLLSTHKYNYFDSMSVDWLKISKWVHFLKFA